MANQYTKQPDPATNVAMLDTRHERWVPGYEGLYSVTSTGEVWSYHKPGTPILLNPVKGSSGYIQVGLRNGSRASKTVHSLVAAAFLGERPHGFEVCHNDGNKLNNSVDNLRYDTKSNNEADKLLHGTHTRGERYWANKISNAQAEACLRLWLTGDYETFAELARAIGEPFTLYNVRNICSPNPNNRHWRWLRDHLQAEHSPSSSLSKTNAQQGTTPTMKAIPTRAFYVSLITNDGQMIRLPNYYESAIDAAIYVYDLLSQNFGGEFTSVYVNEDDTRTGVIHVYDDTIRSYSKLIAKLGNIIDKRESDTLYTDEYILECVGDAHSKAVTINIG